MGETFRPVQGQRFAHPLVSDLIDEFMAEGAAGAGQSSWGPAVFGLFGSEAEAERAADRLRGREPAPAWLGVTAFDNQGARCWSTRTPSDPTAG